MPGSLAADTTLTGGVLVAVVVLGLVELALVVVCLVDIVRRPAVLGGHKWVWVVVVLLFNLVGPIVYLAVGRVSLPAADDAADPQGDVRDRATAAADLLYGPPPEAPRTDEDVPSPPPAR
jgi:Phospholipase_D-nuclease N-terminal